MRRKEKKVYWDNIKSPLQKLFVRRLHEEMKKQDNLSDNALSERCDEMEVPVGQSSVSRITGGRQDPSLENVHALAKALGLPAWYLLIEADSVRREIIRPPEPPKPGVVRTMPGYPKTFTRPSDTVQKSQLSGRKSRRRV